MKILILNIGSSSIKYDLFYKDDVVLEGYLERVANFEKGMKKIIRKIEEKKFTVDAIGHRVVHGGIIEKSCLIDGKTMRQLEKVKDLAPLHNIPELKGIKICLKLFKVPQVAIFDTAFHQTMPVYAHTYALPFDLMKKYGIRRYGFHGSSHKYVSREAARVLKKPISALKIITCHLGNGASVAAICKGKSIDTSMGFTPLEGLVMGTRCGDVDPAAVLFLQKKEKSSIDKMEILLNKQSGLKGLCGLNDMRDIFSLGKKGNKKAKLATDVFCYRLIKYIGAYAAAMNGVDAIVFTAGIGEHAWWVREQVMKNFVYLGAGIDLAKNRKNKTIISTPRSKVKILVVKTNEELMMCEEVKKVLI